MFGDLINELKKDFNEKLKKDLKKIHDKYKDDKLKNVTLEDLEKSYLPNTNNKGK